METFNKHIIFLRGLLTGYGYFEALRALEFAAEVHTGLRKDGVTREFHHQLAIAQLIDPVLVHCTNPEVVMAAIMLHDVIEDYPELREEIRNTFSPEVYRAVCALDKSNMTTQEYYDHAATDASVSIVKGGDRLHNVMTMAGVFKLEKILRYIEETRTYTLPMLKKARRLFPHQGRAYVYLSQAIEAHLRTIEAMLPKESA